MEEKILEIIQDKVSFNLSGAEFTGEREAAKEIYTLLLDQKLEAKEKGKKIGRELGLVEARTILSISADANVQGDKENPVDYSIKRIGQLISESRLDN